MLVASLALLALSQTWLVDAAGTGDFTDLQSAVNAATPGDSIHVVPGSYSGDVLVDRTLRIHGLQGGVGLDGTLDVKGAGSVSLSNLSVYRLSLTQVPGHVRVRDLTANGYGGLLTVVDCPDVLISDSSFSKAPVIMLPANPGVAVGLTDCNAIFVDCMIRSGSDQWSGTPGMTIGGVVELELHGTSVEGGPSLGPDLQHYTWEPAIDGILATALHVVISGSSTDLIAGAVGVGSFKAPIIRNYTSLSWSGVTLQHGLPPTDPAQYPPRPYLDVNHSGTIAWTAHNYGPVGTTGLALLSTMALDWIDPLIGGSALYLNPLGVIDIQPFHYVGQDHASSVAYILPAWAPSLPGFDLYVQAVSFTGPTGLEATNPDLVVFE